MPYALQTINAPGTLVAGYRAGDEIPPSVVENWGLVEGTDFAAEREQAEAPAVVVPRPADDTDRGAWVAYAISRGSKPEDVQDAELAELMDLYPEGEEVAADEHPRPAESAKKSEWVLYVNDHPRATAEDQAWAGDDSTTKAQLMAWEPAEAAVPGDTVAVAATEAQKA